MSWQEINLRVSAMACATAALTASVFLPLAWPQDNRGRPADGGPPVSFAPAITLVSPIQFPNSIAAGDLNHDGRADLGVAGSEGGGGVCTTTQLFPITAAGQTPWTCGQVGKYGSQDLQFVDLNRDGNLDAIVPDAIDPFVATGFGDGKGHFSVGPTPSSDCGYTTGQSLVADLNGDNIPDVVATVLGVGTDPGCIAIFFGKNDGEFSTAQNLGSGGNAPVSVAVGDLNHDGIPDLVVANFGFPLNGDYGNVAVLLGNGDGTFREPILFSGLRDPAQVILADFNGDGNLDIAALGNGASVIWVALGKGDGTFHRAKRFPAGYGSVWVSAADFNGDGIVDLVVSNVASPQQCYVSVLLGNGDGTFQKPRHFPVGLSPWQVVVADFNGDGKPDIATINGGDSTISILLNATPWPTSRR